MNCILEILLYCPRVYSGLDHLMVALAQQATGQGCKVVCVYCDTMENMPQLQADIEAAGGIIEIVSGQKKQQTKDIWRLYQKYHPVVVDTHFESRAKIQTCIYSALFRAKHFTHVHSLLGDVAQYQKEKGSAKRVLLGLYYDVLALFSRRVFCISEAIHRQYVVWSYGKCRNVDTLYIGTPLCAPNYTRQAARTLLGLPQDVCIITNISAIEYIKGIDLIIRAVALLKQKGIMVLFVHIGGLRADTQEQKDYAASLFRLAKELGVEQQVIWLGKRNDIQDILPMANVYVHPSRSEGLGSVLMEASVAGLPLVGTNVGGIPEVVKDGQTGVLVESEDVHGLSMAIEKTLNNPTYGKQAYDEVYSHFSQTRLAGELLDSYRK